jgi:hypothetical protein
MTLQPIPSEFPYIWGKFDFFFVTYHFPAKLKNRFPLLLRQREAFGHPSQICRTYWIQKIKSSQISFFFQVIIINTFCKVKAENSIALLFQNPHVVCSSLTQLQTYTPYHGISHWFVKLKKKKKKFSSKFRMEQLQSHIWGRAS